MLRPIALAVTLFAVGCTLPAGPEPTEENAETTETTSAAMQVRRTTPGGCYISICKGDGSGQYSAMLQGDYVCDYHGTCVCERDGHSATCGFQSTDCRQTCKKTAPAKFEVIPPTVPTLTYTTSP